MVVKRKAVSTLVKTAKTIRSSKHQVEEEEETEGQIVAVAEEPKELSEKELVASRTKELQAMPAAALKELLLSSGLATGTKEVMVKAMLKHEAKVRLAAREQKAKIRAVVVKMKQELENLSTSDLSKRCERAGLKGLRSKDERVQRLLVEWQEKDGVDKALAEIAEQERKKELDDMDSTKLQKLCNKLGVDPYVKEIMVERVSKREYDSGCYARPVLPQDHKAAPEEAKTDMVDALMANEAQRKKELALRSQQEEAAAKKRKDLKAMSLEDLKKRIAKKGLDVKSGKKEDMVDALFVASMQEDAANLRKTELQSKSLQELKDLLTRTGLETGSKDQMVKALLAHEAKKREELKAFDVKVGEVAIQKQEELEDSTNTQLKDMCQAKGLPVGGTKDERIERIVEESQKDGDLDKIVSANLRNKRKEEMMGMDKTAVVKLCEKAGVDPLVKDVMVERILMHQSEAGEAIAMNDAEPASKRARKK